MIKAEHSRIARLVFNPYINRLIKKSFSNFYTVNEPPIIPKDKSLIVTPNHISWWDGFFIDYISRKIFDRKMYLMMLESSLKRFWFFKKVGAYSIEPDNPRSIINTLNYTDEILTDPKNYVVIYPQGEIESIEKRPISIKNGLKLFVKNNISTKMILPIAFKIQYYDKKNPAVLCRFGELIKAEEIFENYNLYINKFTENLDLLNTSSEEKLFLRDLLK